VIDGICKRRDVDSVAELSGITISIHASSDLRFSRREGKYYGLLGRDAV
jgi:hypothetical protein